jgi:hypothetical protein
MRNNYNIYIRVGRLGCQLRKVQSSPWAKMFQNIAARGLRPVEFESDEDSLFDYLCYLSFQVSQLDPQGI